MSLQNKNTPQRVFLFCSTMVLYDATRLERTHNTDVCAYAGDTANVPCSA